MKARNGFTIVELVIVIAIIAILAAVLVPTFSNVIDKARNSSAMQAGKSEFSELYALDYADGKLDESQGNVKFTSGSDHKVTLPDYDKCTYVITDGKVTTFTYEDSYYRVQLVVDEDASTWTSTKLEAGAE